MSSSSPWVLKKFQVDQSGMTGFYLNLEARQPGLGAFILNLMGLDPNASVRVTSGAISMRQASIYGMDQVTAALTSVGAFLGGYKKPVAYLFSAVFFMIAGIGFEIALEGEAGGIIIGFCSLVAIVNVLLYIFKKEMYIGFETAGGDKHQLVFKQAVIEGIAVNIERVESVIEMVNDLISEAASGKSVNRSIPTSMLSAGGTVQVAQQAPLPATTPLPAAQPVAQPAPAPAPTNSLPPANTNSPGLRPGGSPPY